MATQTLTRPVERSSVYYGWVIWAVATLGFIATSPGQAFSISLFNNQFITEFGLSRTAVSTLFGVGTFVGALSLTWVGRKIDLHGNRKVGVVIGIAFTVVLILMSVFITGPFTLLIAFVAIRFLGQGALGLTSTTAISQWWRRKRAWTMSLALVMFALFQYKYPTVVQSLIESYGWRSTWILLGLFVGVTIIPAWWILMRDRPEDHGLLPDGAVMTDIDETTGPDIEDHWTLKEVMRSSVFWLFIGGRMVSTSWGSGLIFHQVSIFASHNHSTATVASYYGLMSLVNAGATLLISQANNRLRPGWLMSIQLTGLVASLVLATTLQTQPLVTALALAFGVVCGLGATFDATVWADLFGRQHIGAIRGFVTTALIIGSAVGPVIFGFCYDQLGSYNAVLWIGAGLAIFPLVGCLFANKPRRKVEFA